MAVVFYYARNSERLISGNREENVGAVMRCFGGQGLVLNGFVTRILVKGFKGYFRARRMPEKEKKKKGKNGIHS